MIKSKWFYHPLFIFIFSLVALVTSLFIYIRSYLKVNQAFNQVVLRYNLNAGQFLQTETWVVILVLSLLVAIILSGLFIIYIYYQKVIELYRLQQNFINGFTHELKTPIASLQLFLDTFLKHELSRIDQLKYLEYMKNDTIRLSDNVNRILHLGRLEDKSFKANFLKQDLNQFVEKFLSRTSHLFENVEIQFLKASGAIEMEIDPELFEMLLMNMMTNAVKYNKSEHKKIKISLSLNKKNAELQVSDNGVGIDRREFKKVFRKFYQVGKTSKGSGLGLYIVASICKLHHGDIEVLSSSYESGTTFKLVFEL
jgi:two-component system phosphate regulon sensor histidine kinase PhoR